MRLTNGNPYVAGTALLAGILAVVVLAASINVSFGLPFNLSMGLPPSQDYTLGASFKDAAGLIKGANVVIAGTQIGEVTNVTARGGEALVTMRIKRQFSPLHRGTIARIRYSTLLAEKYVELTPAQSTPMLANGATIPSDETVTPVDFDQFLSSLDPQTRRSVQLLVQQLGGGVSGRRTAINGLLDQLSGLAVDGTPVLDTLHSRDPQIASITDNLAVASGRLAQSHQQLGDLVGRTAIVTGTLDQSTPQLDTLIVHLANVSRDADQTLSGNEGNLNQSVDQTNPLLAQLNAQLATTNPLITGSEPELRKSFSTLTPEIVSAIAQQDANGNFLRQFVVLDLCYDTRTKTVSDPKSGCLVQALTGLTNPDTTSSNGPQPNPTSWTPGAKPTVCPSPVSTPKTAPTPTPVASPCPTPSPCMPPAGPTPTPTPSPSPTCQGQSGGGAPGGILDPIKGIIGGILGGGH
jgi:virulence factor Mce-like protein